MEMNAIAKIDALKADTVHLQKYTAKYVTHSDLELALKKHRILENKNKKCDPSLRSEWVKLLQKNKLLSVSPGILSHFSQSFDQSSFPIPNVSSYTQLSEEPKGRTGTKELFGSLVNAWTLPLYEHATNIQRTPTLALHKPGYLLRKKGRTGEQSIVVVGEIKPMPSRSSAVGDFFPDEDRGQILDFLHTALEMQPWRTFIYGFLTDCRRFEFVRATRVQSEVQFVMSGPDPPGGFTDDAGWTQLRMLLNQDENLLGFQDVSIDGWELGVVLGNGATSVVSLVKNISDSQAKPAVCKLYLSSDRGSDYRRLEHRALELIADVPGVPQLVKSAPEVTSSGLSVLLTRPVGLNIMTEVFLPISAFAPLVQTLSAIHSRELLHNDISPDNIFAVRCSETQYQVFLNDFGSALTMEEVRRTDIARTRVLYYDHFGADADLLALVRSVFYITQRTFDPSAVRTCAELDAVMLAQLPFWRKALELGTYSHYEQLAALLEMGHV